MGTSARPILFGRAEVPILRVDSQPGSEWRQWSSILVRRYDKTLVLGWCLAIFGLSIFGLKASGQSSDTPLLSTNASDATLRACTAPSADRIWLVGDRGLILATDNGGRTWIEQESDTTVDLHGVAFDDDKSGWVVGGSVQPYSHRSTGTILATYDGGKNWRSIGVPELPRLTGIQSFGGGHLIVWGDWSPTLQTGLIESLDGGATWNPRELPASHLQSCAWYDAKRGVAIDRLSRVFYLSANAPPELMAIGGDPTKPLLAAAINETGWWLVGACGQVYWSTEGRKWIQRSLPGNARDHRWINIQGLTLMDDHVWLLGTPGNVVWHSDNCGIDWEVQSLSTTLPMHCIGVSTQNCLVAAGTLANIQGTRNCGHGWWPIHTSGSRVALLNVATTIDHLAWDALAYMANETRYQAAAFVIHEQNIYERTDALCDSHHRITGLANPLGLSFLEISSQFPIGDLPKGRRACDIAAYSAPANDPSIATSTLALWIRMVRPETILCDEKCLEDPLLVASADAVKLARRLASEASFRCFSAEAGIAEQAWNCKRIVARSVANPSAAHATLKRRTEISFASTTALKSTGKLLSNVLSPVVPTIADYSESGREGFQTKASSLYADYNTVYGPTSKTGKDQLLVEMTNAAETRRPQLRSRHANFQTLIAGSQQSSLIARMLEMEGPDLFNDVKWQASLKSFLRSTPAEQHADSLWHLAQEYRHQGYWNRWRVCLESLIAEAPRSGAAELACLQELQFLGSDEINLFRSKSGPLQSSSDGGVHAPVQGAVMSSPFAQDVQLASHALKQTKPSISRAEEFQRIQASVPIRFPMLQWDPRYLVADAAFQRQVSNGQPSSPTTQPLPLQRLASCQGLVAWQAIGIQEVQANNRTVHSKRHAIPTIGSTNAIQYPIRKTDLRPKLDGRLEDQLWQSTVGMPLESAWMEDQNAACAVRMAHDGEFLFIAVTSRRGTHDRIHRDQAMRESLTFRFDTDRDYLTWFELQVDEEGQVVERCTDMKGWQPEWYFKTESEADEWRLEAAIPIAQLQAEPVTSNTMWAMAIQRAIPNQGVQTNRAMYADRLLLTSSGLVRYCDSVERTR